MLFKTILNNLKVIIDLFNQKNQDLMQLQNYKKSDLLKMIVMLKMNIK